MFQAFALVASQILSVGGFKVTEIPRKIYAELVTALQLLVSQPIVMIPGLIELAMNSKGRLLVDDTSNPKYGLTHSVSILKLLSTSGYSPGYKILLLLWECNGKRFPIGFALWHKGTAPLTSLFLQALSLLRNRYQLRPISVSFDAAYMTDEIAKRLDDYNWAFVSRFKKNRKLSGTSIRHLIPRGYGTTGGYLENGTKVKVVRKAKFFLVFNRMSWSKEKAFSEYKVRWLIEETFRILKTCLHLNGCHQHSMQAQAIYIFICLILFSSVESSLGSDLDQCSPYKIFQEAKSGNLKAENILIEDFLKLC